VVRSDRSQFEVESWIEVGKEELDVDLLVVLGNFRLMRVVL
jgi:hypothetical protein